MHQQQQKLDRHVWLVKRRRQEAFGKWNRRGRGPSKKAEVEGDERG